MRLFVDTNIIVEYIEHRRWYDDVKLVLMSIREGQHIGVVSQGCIYTLVYLVERMLKARNIHRPEQTAILRKMMTSIVRLFESAGINRVGILEAMASLRFDDLEDSLQYRCAVESHCSVLLTINVGDYKDVDKTLLEVMTPSEFVEKYLRKD